MYQRLLVTGGAGFLGVHVVAHLLTDPSVTTVTVLDTCGYTAAPQALPTSDKLHFIRGDVRDEPLVTHLVHHHDAVVHLAAETFVDSSIADDRPFVDTNIGGTATVLRALREVGEPRRLLHASTDEVWGEAIDAKFTETTPYQPRNPYAATKAAADHLVRAYGITHGIDAVTCHFSNLYGPWQYPEKLIPYTVSRLLRGDCPRIYGDGSQSRTWLHVTDAARALARALDRGGTMESYLIGGATEHTTVDVVKRIICALHMHDVPMKFTANRPGHDARYAVDTRKARRELGWMPSIDFGDGLIDTVIWLAEHDGWWTETPNGSTELEHRP